MGPGPQPFPLSSLTRESLEVALGFPRGKIEPPAIGAFHSDLAPPSAPRRTRLGDLGGGIADFFEISEVRGPASEAAASEARRARDGPAPLTEKAKEDERSAWANVLANGICGWSSFTDTGEAVDRRVEEGEHAESAPRAAERVGDHDSGAPWRTDPKRGAGDKPSVPRQGHLRDLSKKDGPADAGEVDEKSGDKAGKAKAPGLDPGWKQYRRDVEWQCRWLELRMKEVGGHIERYERMLRGIEQAKAEVAKAKETKEMASASVTSAEGDVAERKGDFAAENAEAPAKGSEPLVAPMKRRRRRDPERAKPPPPVLAAHPLFDEAEEAKREAREGPARAGGRGRRRGARARAPPPPPRERRARAETRRRPHAPHLDARADGR